MEFSELFHGKHCVFSTNGKFLACLCGDSVEVRYTNTLLKAFKFEPGDVVKAVKWSGDSSLLLCYAGLNKLKVYSIHSGSCIASLRQPMGCMNQILWAADSRTVLFLEPQLFRVTVWKLCEQNDDLGVQYINNVQPWARPGIALSPNGKHLAVVSCGIMSSNDLNEAGDFKDEDSGGKADSLSILSAISWRKESNITCLGTQRVGGIVWSPNSNTVVVWPNDPPDPVLIICTRSDSVIGQWQFHGNLWPGVSEVVFSPSAQFMSVVSLNSKVFVINCTAWCEELELEHHPSIRQHKCKVYQELSGNEDVKPSFAEIVERPVSVSFISNLCKTRRLTTAVWSSGGRYLASCLALAPAVIWVWSTGYSFNLCCVIVMKHPVQDFQWDPVHNVLAVVDGQDCLVLWNADEGNLKSFSVCTPVSKMLFQCNYLNWCSDGKALAVSSDQNSTVLELPSAN